MVNRGQIIKGQVDVFVKYLKLVVKLEFLCEIPNHMLAFEVGCSYKKNHILQKTKY